MNILLWVLQILLAFHTIIGAVWKFSNSEQALGALNAIPHSGWLAMSIVELISAVALILPLFSKRFGITAPIAALYIAAEMVLFCLLQVFSGQMDINQIIYWLVVAVVCAFIAYGRFVLKPVK